MSKSSSVKEGKDPAQVAKSQAINVMRTLNNHINGQGSRDNYRQALTTAAQYINKEFGVGLREITIDQAHQYLTDRAAINGQKSVDLDRQALQCMLHYKSKILPLDEKLDTSIKSEFKQNLTSRMYTDWQIKTLSESMNERNGLSVLIAHEAGLRAHELLTISRIDEVAPSEREIKNEFQQTAHDLKFSERENLVSYTVTGKGGLVREISVSRELADQIEKYRLDQQIDRNDRGIIYKNCHYNLAGGNAFSSAVTNAAKRKFGWSHGAHGLRHTYAQERMRELQKTLPRDLALKIVSLEMGHFRADITEVYLR